MEPGDPSRAESWEEIFSFNKTYKISSLEKSHCFSGFKILYVSTFGNCISNEESFCRKKGSYHRRCPCWRSRVRTDRFPLCTWLWDQRTDRSQAENTGMWVQSLELKQTWFSCGTSHTKLSGADFLSIQGYVRAQKRNVVILLIDSTICEWKVFASQKAPANVWRNHPQRAPSGMSSGVVVGLSNTFSKSGQDNGTNVEMYPGLRGSLSQKILISDF